MSCVGKRLVKSPKNAGKTLCVLGNRLGKVGALGRNGADNGNRTNLARKCVYHAGSFVKLGKSAWQICGESLLGGHFFKSSAYFA